MKFRTPRLIGLDTGVSMAVVAGRVPENAARMVLTHCRRSIDPESSHPLATLVADLQGKGLSRERAFRGVIDAVSCGWLEFGPVPGQIVLTRQGHCAARRWDSNVRRAAR